MKPRHRGEISIFSIGVLDLFASAFGAFVLITIVLMPYYLRAKTLPTTPPPTPAPPAPPQEPAPRLTSAFVLLSVNWDEKLNDVDLHIFDPAKGHFTHRTQEILGEGHPGMLSPDDHGGLYGAGDSNAEMWAILGKAPPGQYKVVYDLYPHPSSSSKNPHVQGHLISREGEVTLEPVLLSSRCVQVGTIVVGADGSVRFQPRQQQLAQSECRSPDAQE
jgi:hypothetical protein